MAVWNELEGIEGVKGREFGLASNSDNTLGTLGISWRGQGLKRWYGGEPKVGAILVMLIDGKVILR